MMSLVTLVTVVGLYAVGLILIVALLVIAPTTARFWTDRLGRVVLVSGLLGAACGYLGVGLSTIVQHVPTGPVIVLIAGLAFAVSLTVAPRRGLVAAMIRRARMRLGVLHDHALRRAYERLESGSSAPLAGVGAARLLLLRVRGLARRAGGDWELTAAGKRDATRVTRNHRLWERYLVSHADIAASHVDYSADRVEHVLGEELVATLEEELERPGETPPSVHPLPGATI